MTVQIAHHLFTTDEYDRMIETGILTEDDRVELLEGEIVEMSPMGSRHAAYINRLNRLLTISLGEQAIVSVQTPIHLSKDSEPEPDLALLKPHTDFYSEAHPEPEDVLLLIEVADTSLPFDRKVKLPLYAKAGIIEVWLVNLTEDTIEVYRQPTRRGYQMAQTIQRGQSLTPLALASLVIMVDELLG